MVAKVREARRLARQNASILVAEPLPLPKIEPEPYSGPGLPLLQRGAFQCAWILTGVTHEGLPVCCGEPVVGLRSWCADHRRVVYEPRRCSEKS